MEIYDINCFYGHWPFRFLRHQSLEELIRTHEKAGITGGAVGYLDSIFYQDPSEGDVQLFRELPEKYIPTLCIDPKLPMALWDIERFRPRAVRVFPGMHGYRLTDGIFTPIAEYLQQNGIPLLVNVRLYVSREAHFFLPQEPDIADELEFLRRYPGLKTAFLGHDRSELTQMAEGLRQLKTADVLFDTAFVRAAKLEPIAEKLGAGRLVFGSCHPLLCLESVRLTIEKSALGEKEKQMIFSENFLRFMA